MATLEKRHQSKVIGWYAVQRVRIGDWLKTPQRQSSASKSNKKSDKKSSEQSTTTSDSSTNSKATTSADSKDTDKSNQTEKAEEATKKLNPPAKPTLNSKEAMKLKAVVRESHTILVKASSVFPLQLFPDSINIDRHKLTIIRRIFFGMEEKVSVPLENVKNVEADLGPFFGSITITSDLFINNTQDVHFLWRDDAKKIQKLVQGAVVAQGEGIDLNKIEVKQLRSMLIDLGSGHTKSV